MGGRSLVLARRLRLPVLAAILTMCLGILAGCAASRLVGYRISPDYPRSRDQTINLPSLQQDVTIHLDQWGIPHIEAANQHDLAVAMGFVHGKDRFFQMDSLRRFVRGRLSEILGDVPFGGRSSIDVDVAQRAWGMDEAADAEAAALDPDTRAFLDAYVDGVNEGLRRHTPLEYRLLGIEPQPWTVSDSIAIGLMNAWSITNNWDQELVRLILAIHVGLDRSDHIYPSDAMDHPATSLPAPSTRRILPPAIDPDLRELFPHREWEPPSRDSGPEPDSSLFAARAQGGASNAWVVGGARSASGSPLLANDPHLSHLVPSIFYPWHLRCPGFHVAGATSPGLPFVLTGRNDRVAWGMTSAVADASDLFIEKTNPQDPNLVLAPDGTWEAIDSVPVVIRYLDGQGMAQKTLSYRRTRNGPLVQDLFPGLLPDRAPLVALRWELRGVGGSFQAFLAAARARNVGELRQALVPHVAPIVVITAADVEGGLAHFAAGRVPVRQRHLGTFPVPGWKPQYQWTNYVTVDDMPAGTGGPDDVFVGANNLLIRPGTGTHIVQAESAPPYRWQRIVERLEALESHDIASFADIQGDSVVLRAMRVAPIMTQDLVAFRFDDPVEVAALEMLRTWDFDATADSAAAAVFFTTWREAVFEALRDEADGPGFLQVLTDGYGSARYDDWFDDPDHPVWDDRETPAVERRIDVVRKAFDVAVSVLRDRLGSNPDKWRWGALHRRKPTHPFGTRSGLGMFNLPESDAPGGLDSVWKATFARTSGDYRIVSGPAYRMIVDLGDPLTGRWIIDTGVSGWPRSPHYGDQYELWRRNQTIPMHFDRESVSGAAVATLKLAGPEPSTP